MIETKAEKRIYKVDQKLISRRVSDASTRKLAFPTPCTKWRKEQLCGDSIGDTVRAGGYPQLENTDVQDMALRRGHLPM